MPDEEGKPSLIGDLAGAGRLADSKLANKVYDDVFAEAGQEVGTALAHVANSCRLLLAPFQLAASWRARLDEWYQRITNDIPKEQQQEAAASVAGPALQNLVFMDDQNPLALLYIELLKRAIDKQRSDEAHPGFVKIIEASPSDEKRYSFPR